MTPSFSIYASHQSARMMFPVPRRFFAPEGGSSDAPPEQGSQPSYIKTMKSMKDWQDALENRERPVMIQAGAAWCGPCNILKPMLIDAVKAHGGKLEFLFVDIDENPQIAQMLRVSQVNLACLVANK